VQLEREKLRSQMVMHYQETKSQEHQCILARHKIIEDRKEYLERLNTVRVGIVCVTSLNVGNGSTTVKLPLAAMFPSMA
jgi:hypothetical protein